MPAMTLRTRWALSSLAILILIGANCGLYLWNGTRRATSMLELRRALEQKDLLLEIRGALEDRQREVEVLEPLPESGAANLDPARLAAFEDRVRPLDTRVEGLIGGLDPRASDTFASGYRSLRSTWMEILASPMPVGPPEQGLPPDVETVFAAVRSQLDLLLENAADRLATAEASLTAAARRSDRVVWSAFTLSLILVIGIGLTTIRYLRTTLDRYVSPQVASSLLESPNRLKMGGRRQAITVLMADLRGFSGLADRLAPETVVTMINIYFEVMTEVIDEYGGTIDEFIGDAMLVIFGAPAPRADHARIGVACAIRMQLAMPEVQRRHRELGLPEVEMGIGINTGEAVIGNVGSERRAKFGAVGRHVNLAARIQSTAVGGQIMVSERTALKAGWDLTIRDGVRISPKGFAKSVGLLDVRGIGGEHELQLSDADPDMTVLATPLAAEISLMTDAGPVATWTCTVSALSPQRAELLSAKPVPLLSSVVLNLPVPAGDRSSSAIHAKVVNIGGATGNCLVVRFTSLTPETRDELERISG